MSALDLSAVARKLATKESLTPEDVQIMQAAIKEYGVHNAAKMLEATKQGVTAPPPVAPLPPQTSAQQEEAALVQAYGTPQRMNR